MKTLNSLFSIKNGISTTDICVSSEYSSTKIPFLRPASTQQRTFSGWVERHQIPHNKIFPAQSLIVSTNGEGSHSYSYVTSFEFSANSDISVLEPRKGMSIAEKLFYAKCITANRYLFSYGRKPKGDRLKKIFLPPIPEWLNGINVKDYLPNLDRIYESIHKISKVSTVNEPQNQLRTVPLRDIFHIIPGMNLELNKLELDTYGVNYVSRTEKNNGVSATIRRLSDLPPIQPPVLTVSSGGSVLETFLQLEEFYTGWHIFYLKPIIEMTYDEMLFYAVCIRQNKYKYSYGRQANRTLKDLLIPSFDSIPTWVNGSMSKYFNG